MLRSDRPWTSPSFCQQYNIPRVHMSKIVVDFSYHKYLCNTENWCKGNNYVKQPEKQKDVGHIMRNASGHYDTLLRTIEGRLEGKRGRGRPRRTWVDDLRDWTGSKRYNQIKKATILSRDICSGISNE